MISAVDILPTVMDAAGLPTPAGVAGKSLARLIEGRSTPWRQALCAEYTSHAQKCFFPRRSIRDRRYKLILNLLTDRPNPVRGVDGCAAWAASRDPRLEGTPARRAHDTCHRPPRVELYDLENDPVEFHNLAGKPEVREIEKRLMAELEQWRRRTDDPLQDPEKLAAMTRSHDQAKPRKKRTKK
jgi:N-sulfoglucosamine sulfohydrolase